MKKLSLKLEDLSVESFDTSVAEAPRGTVVGAGFSDTTCNQIICDCVTNGRECDSAGDTVCDLTCADCGSADIICSNTCPANTCASSCEGTCGCPTWGGETCLC